ncbi:von Willebrand factor type A domain protein [Planctomycetes bacterium Poly30]|uniref:von Willebrand factor type A domain protein n=1 Tax=Saltatorellus ferox TaxID=2528018 RepID=A0A518EMQ6_9BACT|nr:von Willebrand factor type A domain protein [Planctomycetes bacterium Poly30]
MKSYPLPSLLSIGLALAASPLAASASNQPHDLRPWCSHVVLPQSGVIRTAPATAQGAHAGAAVEVRGVDADISIVDGIATTKLTIAVGNASASPQEAEVLLPVPRGAVISGFALEGISGNPAPAASYDVLAKDAAIATYRTIVEQLRDPALLEFAGDQLLRSHVFPVEAGGTRTIRVSYEEVLTGDGQRLDYALARSESLGLAVPWSIDVSVRSSSVIADVYSPTHGLEARSTGPHARSLKVAARADGRLEPGPFRLSVLGGDGPVATTLFSSQDPDGRGGWFLLLAGIGDVPAREDLPPREVSLVIDRSGSMGGAKFDQAIAAARQVLEGLDFGEAIQIIDYASDVERFAPAPVIKTKANLPALRAYLDGLKAKGGTNLDGALQLALRTDVIEGFLPVVLFLTDGLPTEGESREHVIRDRAMEGNVHARRIFTFGVGYDVNASLLDAIADRSRGRATYVGPAENVEIAVADVFQDLSGPVLTDLEFQVASADGVEDVRLVRDVYPGIMPDLYEGDRLLLVGRYTEPRAGQFRLEGTSAAGKVTHTLDVDFAKALAKNLFVPRLWAMRRIAALEDSIRQAGANPAALASLQDDPKFQETVAEMLQLATEHGILTDSTAFLAREGTQLGDASELLATACQISCDNNGARSGASGVAQQSNIVSNRGQAWVNGSNTLYDEEGKAVANGGVQTIQGRTYFRRGARWTAGALALDEAAQAAPGSEVIVGTPEYTTLCETLLRCGRAAELTLEGEILLEIDGKVTLIKQPH